MTKHDFILNGVAFSLLAGGQWNRDFELVRFFYFPLKAFWYDQIEAGLKRVEYREVKPYWSKRLYRCSPGDKIIFSRGYTKRRMMATVTKIEIVNGLNTDLHTDKNVYAIHFENVQKYKG